MQRVENYESILNCNIMVAHLGKCVGGNQRKYEFWKRILNKVRKR